MHHASRPSSLISLEISIPLSSYPTSTPLRPPPISTPLPCFPLSLCLMPYLFYSTLSIFTFSLSLAESADYATANQLSHRHTYFLHVQDCTVHSFLCKNNFIREASLLLLKIKNKFHVLIRNKFNI